jgi:hypothetical protein
MARKKAKTGAQFLLFDVLYEDGTLTSNRRVPTSALGGLEGDAPAETIIDARLRDRRALRPAALARQVDKPGRPAQSTLRPTRQACRPGAQGAPVQRAASGLRAAVNAAPCRLDYVAGEQSFRVRWCKRWEFALPIRTPKLVRPCERACQCQGHSGRRSGSICSNANAGLCPADARAWAADGGSFTEHAAQGVNQGRLHPIPRHLWTNAHE